MTLQMICCKSQVTLQLLENELFYCNGCEVGKFEVVVCLSGGAKVVCYVSVNSSTGIFHQCALRQTLVTLKVLLNASEHVQQLIHHRATVWLLYRVIVCMWFLGA